MAARARAEARGVAAHRAGPPAAHGCYGEHNGRAAGCATALLPTFAGCCMLGRAGAKRWVGLGKRAGMAVARVEHNLWLCQATGWHRVAQGFTSRHVRVGCIE